MPCRKVRVTTFYNIFKDKNVACISLEPQIRCQKVGFTAPMLVIEVDQAGRHTLAATVKLRSRGQPIAMGPIFLTRRVIENTKTFAALWRLACKER